MPTCLAHWALELGIGDGHSVRFKAPDGFHTATKTAAGIKLSMNPVSKITSINATDAALDTGSPHYVRKCTHIPPDFVQQARNIRESELYKDAGINVNFYQVIEENQLKCRTFERGVEDETLSCGTGVTAVALAYAQEISKATHLQFVFLDGDVIQDYLSRGPATLHAFFMRNAQAVMQSKRLHSVSTVGLLSP